MNEIMKRNDRILFFFLFLLAVGIAVAVILP